MIGIGVVGGRVAVIARAFGMYVLGIRKSQRLAVSVDEIGTLDSLSDFLPRVDVVVRALPPVLGDPPFVRWCPVSGHEGYGSPGQCRPGSAY